MNHWTTKSPGEASFKVHTSSISGEIRNDKLRISYPRISSVI